MEDRLRRHDDKRGADGWKGETLDFLFDRLQAEVDELQVARLPGAIAEEAADVASFAMMIADVAGGLSDRTVRVLQQRRAANEPTDVAGGCLIAERDELAAKVRELEGADE
jgi:NTP pyrophosphatase (non-canonical NTP hydrolase)